MEDLWVSVGWLTPLSTGPVVLPLRILLLRAAPPLDPRAAIFFLCGIRFDPRCLRLWTDFALLLESGRPSKCLIFRRMCDPPLYDWFGSSPRGELVCYPERPVSAFRISGFRE